jgi:hypothetical protein|tara:strand:- start:407 stop:697 length:291 start_codon:yes stop_codon:yes gene_type:complete
MSNQSLVQQSVRDLTGTELTYMGDWQALFDQNSIPAGAFAGRMLAWKNAMQSAWDSSIWDRSEWGANAEGFTNLNEALQAIAAAEGRYNFNSVTSI